MGERRVREADARSVALELTDRCIYCGGAKRGTTVCEKMRLTTQGAVFQVVAFGDGAARASGKTSTGGAGM